MRTRGGSASSVTAPLLRHGVARVLEAADGPALVFGAGTVDEVTAALARGDALAGDVLLVDLRLAPGCLAEVVARLAGLGFAVLVLSSGPPDDAGARCAPVPAAA